MPIHEFKCENCGMFEQFFKMSSDIPQLLRCPKCGKDSPKQYSCPRTSQGFWAKPIAMFSLAPVKKAEVEAFCRANPDIKCDTNFQSEMYGVPVVHNEQERSRVLKHFHYTMKEKKR